MAIQQTQYGTGLKLREKFHGTYKVTTVKSYNRYNVESIGDHAGPSKTSTFAEYMTQWKYIKYINFTEYMKLTHPGSAPLTLNSSQLAKCIFLIFCLF